MYLSIQKQPVPPPRSRWNGRKDMEAHQTYYPPSRLTSIQRSLLTPYNYNSGEDPLAMFQQPTTEYDTGLVYYHGNERGRTNTRQSSIYRPDPIYSNTPTYDEAPVDYWKPKPRYSMDKCPVPLGCTWTRGWPGDSFLGQILLPFERQLISPGSQL